MSVVVEVAVGAEYQRILGIAAAVEVDKTKRLAVVKVAVCLRKHVRNVVVGRGAMRAAPVVALGVLFRGECEGGA